MRETLIKLVNKAVRYAIDNCKSENPKAILETQDIADHLITNGVKIPVQCKDCDQWIQFLNAPNGCCGKLCIPTDGDFFCSYGERGEQ